MRAVPDGNGYLHLESPVAMYFGLSCESGEDKCEEICDCTYVEVNRNKYIIGVGWDRKINMFYSRGHKEDILCIAQCPPTLLATSSYDGEIIIWNMISGRICHKFHTPILTSSVYTKTSQAVAASISQVLFLKTRVVKYESATSSLISNGPQGYVHFWSLFSEDPLVASFTPSREKSLIRSIAVTADDSYLYAADEDGYVYVHDIKEYALQDLEQEAPK
ncbi:UNVERIFIED_CONTAM: hypothetical protein K2H54_065912, partial [Gekko kuhli]